jgi:hypothetical protein
MLGNYQAVAQVVASCSAQLHSELILDSDKLHWLGAVSTFVNKEQYIQNLKDVWILYGWNYTMCK